MKLIVRFWREYAHAHLGSYLLGVLFLIATGGLNVLIPRLIQWSIDTLKAEEPALYLAVAILGAGLGVMIVRTLSRTLIFNPGRTIEYTLKRDLFHHLLKLPRHFYEVELSAGEIINRGTNDTAAIRGLIGFGSLQLFNVLIMLSFTLSQMFLIDPTIALGCMIPLGLAVIILRWAILKMFVLQREALTQMGALGDQILESYTGVNAVRLFGAHQGITARFDQENERLRHLSERVQVLAVWGLPIVSVTGQLCLVIALYWGGLKIAAQELTLGELSAMIVYINLLVSSLTSLGWLTGAIQRGYISLGRVYEVLDTSTPSTGISTDISTDTSTDTSTLSPVILPTCSAQGRSIEVKQLSFTHPTGHQESLSELTLSISAGEVIGIFGLTGSGKSTLLDLLSRTYEPPPDTVFMDGVDITTLSLNDYWGEVGYVQQTPHLFSLSLRENIALAGESPTDSFSKAERLDHALQSACLTEELSSFPQGIETPVGERGVKLSGGQKQRASLARAFYRDDIRLLLLDDVLSAVDHHTELKLIDAIYQREPRCTTVIISHRMSVLQSADRVLVFDEGRLVESGTPETLKAKDGLYADAWRAQHSYERPQRAQRGASS